MKKIKQIKSIVSKKKKRKKEKENPAGNSPWNLGVFLWDMFASA